MVLNRFINYTIRSFENIFAPRCKCKRNKPKPISSKEWIKGYKKWKKK